MHRRAQVTLFILLGLVIVAGAFIIFFMRDRSAQTEVPGLIEAPTEIQPIKFFVEECIRTQLEEAVKKLPLQGGYYQAPDLSTTYSFLDIPYYYHHSELNLVPTEPMLSEQLSLYLEETLPDCIQDFRSFRSNGFEVDQGQLRATAMLTQARVEAQLAYPLRIRKAGREYTLDRFSSRVDSAFRNMYGYAAEIVSRIEEQPDYLPVSFLIDLAALNGFTVETVMQDEGSVIYSLNDLDAPREPRIFAFAVKYDWEDSSEELRFATIPPQTAYVGYEFTYEARANREAVTFSDYTQLFDIDPATGEIAFIPDGSQVGLHNIRLIAKDSEGGKAQAMMVLEVIAENSGPTIDPISDKTLGVGEVLSYSVQATDPEGDHLFYHVETGLSGVFLNLMNGELTYTAVAEDLGSHDVTITVLDTNNPPVEQSFTIKVVP
jgi:hypothetical protein